MKIYLDDEREAPDGWFRTLTAFGTISLLSSSFLRDDVDVLELSLDHDLGTKDTGYTVLLWIEEQVATNGYIPPKIQIHTANSSARVKMELAVQQIEKILSEVEV